MVRESRVIHNIIANTKTELKFKPGSGGVAGASLPILLATLYYNVVYP